MTCPKCQATKLTGPVYVMGLCETVWNQYRCTSCGFTRHEPCDDDPEERRLLTPTQQS